jgi:hypothetical protein
MIYDKPDYEKRYHKPDLTFRIALNDKDNLRSFCYEYLGINECVLDEKNIIYGGMREVITRYLTCYYTDVTADFIIKDKLGHKYPFLFFIEEMIHERTDFVYWLNACFITHMDIHKYDYPKIPYPMAIIVNPGRPWRKFKKIDYFPELIPGYQIFEKREKEYSYFVEDPDGILRNSPIKIKLLNLAELPPNLDDMPGTEDLKLMFYSLRNRYLKK